jgi:hypothetical protein
MKYFLLVFSLLYCSFLCSQNTINRKKIVDRHKVVTTKTDPESPASVGNGEFAFNVDITGLQTFEPFNTLSNWSWHSFPLPTGVKLSDYKGVKFPLNGKTYTIELPDRTTPGLAGWMNVNPHRFNLGRIGLILRNKEGAIVKEEDLTEVKQIVDMWTGIITSYFSVDGKKVKVQTAVDSKTDAIGVSIESALLKNDQISLFYEFPYVDGKYFDTYVGVWDKFDAHQTSIESIDSKNVLLKRVLDDVKYWVNINWAQNASFVRENESNPHRFLLKSNTSDKLELTVHFAQTKPDDPKLTAKKLFENACNMWKDYWESGAAIDLSNSLDPRWKELERRIVTSQYLMRAQEAGSYPPQESGLTNNGWRGRYHFEMIWWHSVHFPLWGRWELVDKYMGIYERFFPTSAERAKMQGRRGVKWPKCTGNTDVDNPAMIESTLLWQQPHPIYFAEQDYRLHPTRKTLDKWKDIVTATADYMVDRLDFNFQARKYVINPPLHAVAETTDPLRTNNPAFELSYWLYGLRIAQKWNLRLELPLNKQWEEVSENLAPLPQQDSVYVIYENIEDMWTKYNWGHPAMIGVWGMLPGDGVDETVFRNTLDKIMKTWKFDETWGWDFPLLAMAAARSGNPDLAVDMLLFDSPQYKFDIHGLATGGPKPYFPSNGALLTAVAMMTAGWDGSKSDTPGFPQNGKWIIKHEGFNKMQ